MSDHFQIIIHQQANHHQTLVILILRVTTIVLLSEFIDYNGSLCMVFTKLLLENTLAIRLYSYKTALRTALAQSYPLHTSSLIALCRKVGCVLTHSALDRLLSLNCTRRGGGGGVTEGLDPFFDNLPPPLCLFSE